MLEPLEGGAGPRDEGVSQPDGGVPQRRLRNESYLGAVNKDIHIRAGLQVKEAMFSELCELKYWRLYLTINDGVFYCFCCGIRRFCNNCKWKM